MAEVHDRVRALRELVACRQPLDDSIARVREFSWDSERELVGLSVGDIVAVLRRYVGGELSNHDVEAWADALEVRDDVAYVSDEVKTLLFWLSSPEINAPITPAMAADLIERYDRPSSN